MSSIGNTGLIAFLGLFSFLVFMGARSQKGSVCSRGWLAFLTLPISAAVFYTLAGRFYNLVSGNTEQQQSTQSPRKSKSKTPGKSKTPSKSKTPGKSTTPKKSKSTVSSIKKSTSSILKAKGFQDKFKKGSKLLTSSGGIKSLTKGGGTLQRVSSLVGFSLFLAFMQYLITAIILVFQKPNAPKSTVFKKSFIAAGISLLLSIGFIVAVTVVSNIIPAVKAVFTVMDRIPFIGSFTSQYFYFTLAFSPLHMLGAWIAYLITCGATN